MKGIAMRTHSLMAAAAMLMAASPAVAATIVQDLPAVQSFGDFTPFDINGAAFNPALGTLTSVTATLTGSYTPIDFLDLGPFPNPGTVSTSYFVITPQGDAANQFSGSLGTQTVIPVVPSPNSAAVYTGTPTAVDLNFAFPVLSDFVSAVPGSTLLAEFGFLAGVEGGGAGGASDGTTFNGTFALTYTYGPTSVPEPSSLLLLGCAASLVPVLMRRRRV
jgi:hypothetical protein